MDTNNLFYTQSLNIVAWLISKGHKIVGKIKNKNTHTFYFKKDEKLQFSIDEYNSNLELKKFITSFKKVKDLIKNDIY